MNNTNKYLYIKYEGKNVYEIVDKIMEKYESPLFAVKKIREVLPGLSLMEAKEIVIIRTTEHKSLYDYQGSLLKHLEELDMLMKKENGSGNV
jgi:hypothetical protein